jgi:hypothetical protein
MFCITLKGDMLVAIDFKMVNDMNVAIEITNTFLWFVSILYLNQT